MQQNFLLLFSRFALCCFHNYKRMEQHESENSCRWEEIAGRLGVSERSVYRLHRRALALLAPPPEIPA